MTEPNSIPGTRDLATSNDVLPPGIMGPYAGSTAPSGWLLCDGSVVSRTTYAALFAVVGTNFNTGGEAGTDFRLPDMRGRVPVGVDGAAARLTASDALGNASGAEKHTLITAEMPSHAHSYAQTVAGSGLSGGAAFGGSVGTTGSTGGGGAHNNMQPYQITQYIIKI